MQPSVSLSGMPATWAVKAAENYESTKDSFMSFMTKCLEAILEHDLFSCFYSSLIADEPFLFLWKSGLNFLATLCVVLSLLC